MTQDSNVGRSQNFFLKLARSVIEKERQAIEELSQRLGDDFSIACSMILNLEGRVIITGMGKSGHIGNKIAATFSSTGTPAYFIHPSEALHGDLGMITADDLVIAISNSGSTDELLILASAVKRIGTKIISLTANGMSSLAQISDVHLNIGVKEEACPLGLAPTSSTTVTLVLGDALAISLLKVRGFTAKDFARSHPGGRLGKRLLVRVEDVMSTGEDIPVVFPGDLVVDAILEMTNKKLGATLICSSNKELLGVFTDGDLRRLVEHNNLESIMNNSINTVFRNCKYFIEENKLAVEAIEIMTVSKVTVLPVLGESKKVVGIIQMHDLLKAGVV